MSVLSVTELILPLHCMQGFPSCFVNTSKGACERLKRLLLLLLLLLKLQQQQKQQRPRQWGFNVLQTSKKVDPSYPSGPLILHSVIIFCGGKKILRTFVFDNLDLEKKLLSSARCNFQSFLILFFFFPPVGFSSFVSIHWEDLFPLWGTRKRRRRYLFNFASYFFIWDFPFLLFVLPFPYSLHPLNSTIAYSFVHGSTWKHYSLLLVLFFPPPCSWE